MSKRTHTEHAPEKSEIRPAKRSCVLKIDHYIKSAPAPAIVEPVAVNKPERKAVCRKCRIRKTCSYYRHERLDYAETHMPTRRWYSAYICEDCTDAYLISALGYPLHGFSWEEKVLIASQIIEGIARVDSVVMSHLNKRTIEAMLN